MMWDIRGFSVTGISLSLCRSISLIAEGRKEREGWTVTHGFHRLPLKIYSKS